MHEPQNIFAKVPDDLPRELIETLVRSEHLRIERTVSHGHASPEGFWYDQASDEWVLLISGAARLRFEGGDAIEMTPGSFVNIPAHARHRVEWTDPDHPTIWLAIYYGYLGEIPANQEAPRTRKMRCDPQIDAD